MELSETLAGMAGVPVEAFRLLVTLIAGKAI